MKKLITILTLLLTSVSFSQEIEKVGGRFYIEGTQISTSQTRELLATNTQALSLFESGKNKESIGGFLVGFGGALVTVDLVIGLFSDTNYPTKASYIGLASVVAAIPILHGKNKKIKNAIALYNDGLKNSGSTDSNIELNVIVNQNGYGLQFQF